VIFSEKGCKAKKYYMGWLKEKGSMVFAEAGFLFFP
jgi:hypothetical protein